MLRNASTTFTRSGNIIHTQHMLTMVATRLILHDNGFAYLQLVCMILFYRTVNLFLPYLVIVTAFDKCYYIW